MENPMITNKLFINDAYLNQCTAKIVGFDDNKNIILDRTIFYAESGGQLGDTGYINNIPVVDTVKRITKDTKTLSHPDFPMININTQIIHVVANNLHNLKLGDEVNIKIDWERRYQIMKMHSAAHVVFHFVHIVFGQLTIMGCYIQPNKARFDFLSKIDQGKLALLQELSNEFINGHYDIENVALDNEPEALYWTCNNIRIPCGGTHVKNTKEIGEITLKRRSQGKTIDRIYVEPVSGGG